MLTDGELDSLNALVDENRALRAEVERLRAVAEAARGIENASAIVGDHFRVLPYRMRTLREALDALDGAGKEGG